MTSTWKDLDEWERRTLLKTLGPAGLGILAGCIGDDDDVPTIDAGTDDSDTDGRVDDSDDTADDTIPIDELIDPRDYLIEGQTMQLPASMEDPANSHFLHRDVGVASFDVPQSQNGPAMMAANGRPASGLWQHSAFNLEQQPFISHIYTDDTDWTPEQIITDIYEDATWSDGEPVRAMDTVIGMLGNGCTGTSPIPGGFYDTGRRNAEFPDGPDGKRMVQNVLPTWLGDGPEGVDPPKGEYRGWLEAPISLLQGQLLGPYPRWGGVSIHTPTHIPYFDCQAETLWEAHSFKWQLIEDNLEMLSDAEHHREFVENDPDNRNPLFRLWGEEAPEDWIEPWGGQICRGQAAVLCVGEGDDPRAIEAVERSRDPEWMTSLGLYEIDEIVGSEGFRLTPNEHHKFYDEHTFDEVFLEWVDDDHREMAGLMAERYDASSVHVTPEEVAVLPDRYVGSTYPSTGGFTLSLNHAYWPGQSVYVRQGLKFAMDESAVSQNIDPDLTAPIITPGLDNWGSEEFLRQDWAEENLQTYDYDLERAEELFERAGFERIDGVWHDAEGELIDESIATSDEAPVGEETIADQWRDFGIEIDTLVMDDTTLEERWMGADDPLTPGIGEIPITVNAAFSSALSGYLTNISRNIGGGLITYTFRLRARNWFDESGGHGHPDEKVAFSEYHAENSFAPINYRRGGSWWSDLIWNLPPAGDFDGEPTVPFAAPQTNQRAERQAGHEYSGEFMPTDERMDREDGKPQFNPEAMNVENVWEAQAWALNWFLPDIPVVRMMNQNFINDVNWLWGDSVPEVSGTVTDVQDIYDQWDIWGLDGGPNYYPSNNLVWADPKNPKLGADVRRT